ncbi:MAG: TMEM165/GDT1 family protein [Promethearchaeota archaeon]|nr:MAG: TMEM165/GDT1 family protein [Candidatus Lokiarchaeota archaeon]
MDLVILFTVFGFLFLAELGDKTQLIIFNLVIDLEEKPYKIGIGASLGFATIITLGIIFGTFITKIIPIGIITILSGIVFILIGILEIRNLKGLYLEMKPSHKNEEESLLNEESNEVSYIEKFTRNPYLIGFFSIFIMELGDKSQILTISLASIYILPLEVWLGSFFALALLTWIGVLFGAIILKYLPKFYIKIIAIIVFISVGIFILLSNLI